MHKFIWVHLGWMHAVFSFFFVFKLKFENKTYLDKNKLQWFLNKFQNHFIPLLETKINKFENALSLSIHSITCDTLYLT